MLPKIRIPTLFVANLEEPMKLGRSVSIIIAVLFIVGAVYGGAQQNPIFADGFEAGTTCAWGIGCPTVTLVDTSATSPVTDTNGSSHEEWADYVIRFTVTAGTSDYFFEKEAERSPHPNLTRGFWFSIENGGNATVYGSGITPFSIVGLCPCTGDTPSHFRVPANATRTFWMVVRLDNVGATRGFYRMRLTGLAFKMDGGSGDATTLVTAGLSSFVTPSVFVDNQNVSNLEGISSYEDLHLRLSRFTEGSGNFVVILDPVENHL